MQMPIAMHRDTLTVVTYWQYAQAHMHTDTQSHLPHYAKFIGTLDF